MAKCRDFSDDCLKKIEKIFTKYFDNINFKDKARYTGKIYKVNANNYREFILSCSKTKDIAYKKIIQIWTAVKDVEKTYKLKYDNSITSFDSISNIIKKYSDSITFHNFKKEYDFEKLVKDCRDDYLNILQSKAEKILDKDPSKWTDEEWEIVSYAYCHTTDEQFVEKVLNSFADDVTAEHVVNNNPNKQIKYYEVNQEQIARFREYCDFYFAQQYDEYINTDYSKLSKEQKDKINRQMNQCIKNYNTAYAFDDKGYIWVEGNNKPITISNGEIICYKAKAKYIKVDSFGIKGSNGINDPFYKQPFSYNEKETISINYKFYDGTSAQTYLDNEDMISRFNDEQIDYSSIAVKALEKYGKKAIEAAIPGFGKAITKIIDIGKKVASTVNQITSTHDAEVEKNSLGDYCDWLGLKYVENGNSYILYPTPATKNRIKYILSQMRQCGRTELYNKYKDYVIPDDYCNGKVDIAEFKSDISVSGADDGFSESVIHSNVDENDIIFEGER